MRLESQSQALWESFPARYHDAVLIFTDLGDVTAIILVLSILYWVGDRKKAAVVASYAAAAVAVFLILKTTFAMPRPEVELIAREYDQYAFPSGHAFMSVVVYGGLLYVFEKHREPLALAAVTTLIGGISLSRIVLGVHYFGDVIAGVVFAIGFLVAMEWLTDRVPWRGFAIGGVLSVPAILFTSGEGTVLAVIAFGAAIGGVIGTVRLEAIPPLRSRREAVLLTGVGLGFIVTVSLLESAIVGEQLLGIAVAHVILFTGILLVPAAIGRIDHPLVGAA